MAMAKARALTIAELERVNHVTANNARSLAGENGEASHFGDRRQSRAAARGATLRGMRIPEALSSLRAGLHAVELSALRRGAAGASQHRRAARVFEVRCDLRALR